MSKKTKKVEEDNKMYKTHQFIVKKDNPLCEYFIDLMRKSNNLYNATNFHIRQVYTALKCDGKLHELQKEVLDGLKKSIPPINDALKVRHDILVEKDNVKLNEMCKLDPKNSEKIRAEFKERKLKVHEMPTSWINYELLDAYFRYSNNPDYIAMPAQVNQAVMKQAYNNWTAFFEATKSYNRNKADFTGAPKPPKYKKKGSISEIEFTNQACKIKDGKFLIFPKTKLKFNLSKRLVTDSAKASLKSIRVQKFYDCIKLEIVLDYTKVAKPMKDKIINCMAIDPGVNNLATCVFSNGAKPVILNGKPLKSMNQYYNKIKSKLYSDLRLNKQPKEGSYTSKRLEYINKKRNLKFKDFMHKASKQIVDLAIANDMDKVIVGYNPKWKVDVVMQKKDKQSFIQIPFLMFYSQLEYKLKMEGIHFELKEESYTSKASFLDGDAIPTYKEGQKNEAQFSGKRIKRGLYKTKTGILINADVNGACNILKKHFDGVINLNHKILSCVWKLNIKAAQKKKLATP